jgi:N-ethylmaleimide reductase
MSNKLLSAYSSPLAGNFKNRVVMSAMTRGFADKDHCATDLIRDYYARRAQDGVALILTEGMVIHPSADGYNNVPHISNDAQAESWKNVTAAIHAAGSKVFSQLWHCGRISHEDYTGGVAPVSASAIQAEGINRQNNKPYGVPHAVTPAEIKQIYNQYIVAADLAFQAGFDGVQLHLGHGYLADSFFDTRVNDRTDQYGGSIENRCRFAVELTQLFLQKYSAEKVMVRISPSREMNNENFDWPNLQEMIEYLIPAFDKMGLRLLDVSCARADYYKTSGRVIRMVRPLWSHFLMGGASLSAEQAVKEIEDGYLNMVTWGRQILANPDFVTKLKNGRELTPLTPDLLSQLV